MVNRDPIRRHYPEITKDEVDVAELSQNHGFQYPEACIQGCGRLDDFLNSRTLDSPTAVKLVCRSLEKATHCNGPEKTIFGQKCQSL